MSYLVLFMSPWAFNPFTSNFDYYVIGAAPPPAGGSFDFIDNTDVQFIDNTYFDYIT